MAKGVKIGNSDHLWEEDDIIDTIGASFSNFVRKAISPA